jgi:sialidase-1
MKMTNGTMIHSMTLFDQKKTPGTSYRIPELCVTCKGTIIAFCEARQGGGDWDPMALVYRRKVFDGDWSDIQVVERNENGPVHNPVAIPLADALLLMHGQDYKRLVVRRSIDDGQSFGEPFVDITNLFERHRTVWDWQVIACGPGGAAILPSGRILVPVWLGLGTGAGRHAPARACCAISDDKGVTWCAGELVPMDGVVAEDGVSEAQVVVHPEGGALMSLRSSEAGFRRGFTQSTDGEHWSRLQFHPQVIDTHCQASLLRLGDLLITSQPNTPNSSLRTNVGFQVSADAGKSYSKPYILHKGESGYSALALDSRGKLLCLYETWSAGQWNHMSLVLAEIPYNLLERAEEEQ